MNKKFAGAVVAAAVAGLFLSGQALAQSAAGGTAVKVKCEGGNACKGKSECKSAHNDSCKGHNGCKGKGWLMMTEEECTKSGGKVAK